ncbi:TM2 domain-containing protein [Paenibacillus sp. 32352]|uniref:TM2 domain-containing protein n=1 Tax=Paenibacillus sp. 32352 TaxID=1969111 RepID=UPI00277B50B7|nr:TM2 domain-containing protein [Paenibacillus sp. 32352]
MYVNSAPPPQQVWVRPAKSKIVAGILAILLGGFGIHKFYLGRVGWGIVYLLFCWTYIPTLISLVEGIIYFASSDESFNMKYGTKTL